MADRGGGAANFLWFIIGFFLGIVATLGSLIYFNRQDHRPAAPPAVVTAPPAPKAPAPAPAATPKPAAAPAAARPDPSDDEQVAEDAAAAGMTSRAPSPAQPGQ